MESNEEKQINIKGKRNGCDEQYIIPIGLESSLKLDN